MDNGKVAWSLKNLNCEIMRLIDKKLVCLGVNGGQSRIIGYIHHKMVENVKVCQKDIEMEVNIRASSVSSVLDNLEKSGLIERYNDENNARVKLIRLTKEGEEVGQKCKVIIGDIHEEMLSNFTEDEQTLFLSFIEKAISNIKEE